jgi:hypothetical protein
MNDVTKCLTCRSILNCMFLKILFIGKQEIYGTDKYLVTITPADNQHTIYLVKA